MGFYFSYPLIMPRRSARICAREAAVSADDFPLSSVDDTESNRKCMVLLWGT